MVETKQAPNGSTNGIDKRGDSHISHRTTEDDDIDHDDFRCGYFGCKPECLRWMGHPKSFIVFLVISSTLALCISGGYLAGILSTIERRYQLPSALSGTLLMFNEIGSLTTILFVTYFGSKGHRPRIIGTGAVLIGIGAIVSALPQLMSPPLEPPPSLDLSNGSQDVSASTCSAGNNATHGDDVCDDVENGGGGEEYFSSLLFFIIGQLIIGTGSTPFIPLGTTYIDDGVKKHETAIYLAFVYACLMVGPMLGYVLCARTLTYYVDFYRVDQSLLSSLTPKDPRWVGAWWIGFLLVGSLIIFASIPLFGFPRRPCSRHAVTIYRQKRAAKRKENKPEKALKEKLKDFPRALCRLFTNVPLMAACLGICCELAVVAGFSVFLPKYLQQQFGIPAGKASMLMGVLVIPGGVVGMVLGGIIVKKYKLSPKGCARMVAILSALKTVAYLVLFVFDCGNANIAGIFIPYSDQMPNSDTSPSYWSACNVDCACPSDIYAPVCGVDGITYISPCHAGCRDVAKTTITGPTGAHLQNFTDCSCILIGHPDDVPTEHGYAMSAPCPIDCDYLWPTLAVVCVGFLVATMAQNPSILFIIRSVAEEDRSLAMGVNIIMMRIFGFIPAPIIFGTAIDSACVLWSETCGQKGACLVYDMVRYRYVYVGTATVFMALGIVCFVVAMRTVREGHESQQLREMEEKVGSRLGESSSNEIILRSRTPNVDAEKDKSATEYFL